MKLKRLSLAGFKTFAERTEIELSEGITAIVGPNGCGKSNVADAILWALGEQNPRLLRGSEGRDFIFAGAERRKPLGMAEVQLVLDNSDGSLPLDYAEIAIARRIYRSGDTRYSINGTACRLKDIVDLFLDTGMGRGAYSFVGQTEVDAVLSARPEDRRELFEEAAGVQKYRTRKREAVRKLETAEANLTRVNDILAEIERQREPLRQQAELAQRYLAATDRLRAVEVGLLIAEIHRCDYELFAAKAEREHCIATVAALDDKLAAMEREAARIHDSLTEAEKEQESASLSRQSAATQVERVEHQLQLTLERERNATAAAEALENEMRLLAQREVAMRTALQRDESTLQRVQQLEQEKQDALSASRQRLEELEAAAERAEEVGRDHAQAQRQLLAERAARESALAACRTRLDEARRRMTELHQEKTRHEESMTQAAERLRAAIQNAEECRTAAARAIEERRHAIQHQRAAEDRKERAERHAAACRRRYTERVARLQALQEMQAAGEGLFQGVRSVLQAARQGALPDRFATVADLLRVPDRLRVAVDVALGSSSQDIVCPYVADARAAIEWLKANRRGRATFLPLDNLRPPHALQTGDVTGVEGVVGIASELVECEPAYIPAVQLLLNRVVVFETLDAGIEAAKHLRGWSRIVTLEGEVLTPGGAVTGGDGAGRGPQLIRRKGEIDDLTAETNKLAQELERLEREAREADAAATEAAAVVRESTREEAARGADRAAAERDLEAAQRESEALHARGEEIQALLHRTNESIRTLETEVAEWESALESDRAQDVGLDDALESAKLEAARCTERAAQARRAVTALQVELGRLGEQVKGLKRSIAAAGVSLAEISEARKRQQEQREELGRRLMEAEAQRRQLTEAGDQARQRLVECSAVCDHWNAERSRRLERSFQLSSAIKEATEERSRTMAALHEADLLMARLEVRLAQYAQRLSEEYGMTMEDALAAPEPAEMDRDTVQEIARLRREIRAMGNVNTGAVDEYGRLTERYEFLAHQRADLQAACASLRETITEIDRNTRSIFMETFRAVEQEFQRLFERLFGGGRAALTLTKPEDLLETGVEILVQPPGKRAQSLSLLSGGERALTAIALLFSFLAVRPSPFVLLDEVDAPLDGSNVDRFVSLVRDFSQDTQFLIITHNPTTIEAASRWYGVTMREPGVSRVIAYQPPARLEPTGVSN